MTISLSAVAWAGLGMGLSLSLGGAILIVDKELPTTELYDSDTLSESLSTIDRVLG